MKIHVISDLHCDRSPYPHALPECDVVVIAGDVAEYSHRLLEICEANPGKRILYVHGNHDFYGKSLWSVRTIFDIIQETCPNLIVMENETVQIDDVVFFGATLWSGLNAYGSDKEDMLRRWYPSAINDVKWIDGWSSDMMITTHNTTKNHLHEFLNRDIGDLKKVVITHFAPSLKSVHEKYANQVPYNSYWCNSMDDMVKGADLWLHGHVHTNFDYMIGKCRVVCNPRGYTSSYWGDENKDFNPSLVLEI